MGWFILGMISTIGIEVFVVLGLLLAFGGSKCKDKCISCKYYSVGTNMCIRDAVDNRLKQIPTLPQQHTCKDYEAVV